MAQVIEITVVAIIVMRIRIARNFRRRLENGNALLHLALKMFATRNAKEWLQTWEVFCGVRSSLSSSSKALRCANIHPNFRDDARR